MVDNILEDTRQNNNLPLAQSKSLQEWVLLAAVLIITFLYRAYFIRYFDVMSADGTGYALSGRAFFKSWNPVNFGTVMPPLYPFLIGLFNLAISDLETAARTVSVFFSTLTIIPLYLMTRECSGKTAAYCATLLYIFLPFLHQMSAVDITEPTYTFFAFAGVWIFWKAFTGRKALLFGLAGIILGIAYLARPEGFIVFFMLTVFLAGMGIYCLRPETGIKKLALFLAGFCCGFILIAFPYMSFLHSETGKWQLSGKTGLNSNIIREYRGKTAVDQHMRLDSNSKTVGGGDATLMDIMKNEPDLFWGNVRDNLKALPGEFTSTFPVYLWPLVLTGLFGVPLICTRIGLRLSLICMCTPLALYILYFVQPRGFYAYIPVLLVFAGSGCARIENLLQRSFRQLPQKLPVMLIAVMLLAAFFIYTALPKPKPPYDYSQDGGRFDDKQVGLKLRTIIPEDAIIMTRSGRIGFYSQRSFQLPPQADLAEIVAFAKKNSISYLIATLQLLNMRPQLAELYNPLNNPTERFTPPFNMELVYLGQEPGGLPYLVYRFR